MYKIQTDWSFIQNIYFIQLKNFIQYLNAPHTYDVLNDAYARPQDRNR